MRAFCLISLLNVCFSLIIPPNLYPFDPRIHNLGNIGFKGKIHAKIAPYFTKAIDIIAYGGVDIRKQELDKYTNKTILDFGCGTGFSTCDNKGCLGIDTSKEMIDEAKKLFPNKRFSGGHAEQFKTDEHFDIVTCMFLMHEVPSFCRKNIINNALSIANEKVVILDIAPVYKPSNIMLEGEPYLPEYLSNISTELSELGFTEKVVIKGHVHKWSYTKGLDSPFKIDPIITPAYSR